MASSMDSLILLGAGRTLKLVPLGLALSCSYVHRPCPSGLTLGRSGPIDELPGHVSLGFIGRAIRFAGAFGNWRFRSHCLRRRLGSSCPILSGPIVGLAPFIPQGSLPSVISAPGPSSSWASLPTRQSFCRFPPTLRAPPVPHGIRHRSFGARRYLGARHLQMGSQPHGPEAHPLEAVGLSTAPSTNPVELRSPLGSPFADGLSVARACELQHPSSSAPMSWVLEHLRAGPSRMDFKVLGTLLGLFLLVRRLGLGL